MQTSLFYCKLKNGEEIDREWMLYSPSTGSIYCFVCRLFSSKAAQFSSIGFDDWKNSISRVKIHEGSSEHKNCLLLYSKRKNMKGCLDTKLMKQFSSEKMYWENILRRLISVIKFIASRGLAFRGENQNLGCTENGIYLGILELISEYDPFLKNHLQTYGNKGRGQTSYLSANICEELIEIMGKAVFKTIINEIKKAKYFSISVDSTPDVSRIDQLTFTVRYVTEEGPVERFLTFIPIEAHGSEYLANVVINFLNDNDICLTNCRGQSYDNAPNMSGEYTGLQTRIKEINKNAKYVPCTGHSMNLIGEQAAGCNLQVTSFFNLVQRLYTFFSASTHRWQKLVSSLSPNQKVLKSLSQTRWSARSDAINALYDGHSNILMSLDALSKDDSLLNEARLDALSLHDKLLKFDNIFFLIVWKSILTQVNLINLTVQKVEVDLSIVVSLLNSLEKYLQAMRGKFNEILDDAKKLAGVDEVPKKNQRPRKRSIRIKRFEGPSEEAVFNEVDSLRVEIFYPIIDNLLSSIKKRRIAYDEINNDFCFLTKLQDMEDDSIAENCKRLANVYDSDVSADELISECVQFKYYLQELRKDTKLSILNLYTQIKNECLMSTFPNIEVCLRIFLCMMVTNCSGERSFSALKFIKNDHRSTMLNSRLNYLSVLYIESDILNSLNIEDIIDDFASKKSRKKL